MANTTLTFTGLSGEEGLLAAVVAQAVKDASNKQHRPDAYRYFASNDYRHHLELLGVPHQLPAVFDEELPATFTGELPAIMESE